MKQKKIVTGKALRRERLGEWIAGGIRHAKDGTKVVRYDCAVSGWGVIDGSERKYRRFKRKSPPSRTVVFTGKIKWQVILVIINFAMLLLLYKLIVN